MPQKKETTRRTEKKAGVKVQDLAPKKDAKGGSRVFTSSSGKKGPTTDAACSGR